jgi:hypothetical protein
MSQPDTHVPLRSPERKLCEECGAPAIARSLCPKHYDRRKRMGTLPPSSRSATGPLLRVKASVPRLHVAKLKRLADQRGVRITDMVRLAVASYLGEKDESAATSARAEAD